MNIIFFVSLLFVLQIAYWIVGKISTQNVSSEKDYFLAGKTVRFFPLMMTFLATQVGGGLVLGAADEAFKFGWPVLLYPMGAALGLILLGSGIGKRLASFPVSTVAQILEQVYGSKGLKRTASLLSIISLFMILVAQIIASRKFLVSVGFTSEPLFLLLWAIVIIYTAQGGLKAVISTDLVQAAFFSLIFLITFGFTLTLPDLSLTVTSADTWAPVSNKLCGWLLMPLLFMFIEQDMAQRCFSGACPRTVSRAATTAGILTMILCFVPVFLGVMGRSMGMSIAPGASVLMTVVEKTTNPTLLAFIGCAVLAAIISTAASLINSISSNIATDFSYSFCKKETTLPFVRTITALISVSSIFFAFFFDSIVDILIQSYDLSVSSLFVPICVALFRKNGSFLSALLAIIFGTTAFCFFKLYPCWLPSEILSLGWSAGGFLIGEGWVMYQRRKEGLKFAIEYTETS